MQTTHTQSTPSLEYCLTLQRFLNLAMHTAETASAEGNHRIVIQAIREGARIVSLILKMDANPDQAPARFPTQPGMARLLDPNLAKSAARGPGSLPGKSRPDLQAKNQRPATRGRSSKTMHPNLETLTADLTCDLLKGMFHPLAGPASLSLINQKWEKSGKLPGKMPDK